MAGLGLAVAFPAFSATGEKSSIEIVRHGAEELVSGADDESCPEERDRWIHVPDTPVNAFRRADGSVVMLAINRRNVPLVGPSADKVGHAVCAPLIRSGHLADPSKYNDNEWLVSVLEYSSSRFVAFIHDEYHGYEHDVPGCKATGGEVQARRCWYASTTYAISRDGGFTFEQPKDHVVAALRTPFSAATSRVGFGNPKALVDPRDGTPYLLVTSYGESGDQAKGQCLLRGDRNDPALWRAWDGTSFSVSMPGVSTSDHASGTCKVILSENIWSVRFHRPSGTFVAFGQHGHNLIYMSSPDLLAWSAPVIIGSFTPFRQWKPGSPNPTQYYSLFDPTSLSPSFDTLEQKPYLYFVRWRIENGRPANGKRDLIRQEITVRRRD